MSKTRRKVKIVGVEQYLNKRTGAVEEMQVVSVEERDANFHKLWLEEIIRCVEIVSNKKIKFVFWLMEQMDEKNQIIGTMRQMVKESGMSLDTVWKTIKALLESNFLVKTHIGVYQVNPDVIFKGGKTARRTIL